MTTYEEAIRRAMKAATEGCKAAKKTKYIHTQYGPNGPDDPIGKAFAQDMIDGFIEIVPEK